MGERDPRLFPLAGDELEGGKSYRYVGVRYQDGQVGFTYWQIGKETVRGNDCVTSIRNWRKWAATAAVIRRAEESDGR